MRFIGFYNYTVILTYMSLVSAVGGMMDFETVYRFMRAFPRKKLTGTT